MNRRRLFTLGLLVLSQTSWAQLLSPDQFLGYPLGSRFTLHHRVVDYFRHVAASSPLVDLQSYGTTYEGRPLYLAIVSSQENRSRMETIRQDNLRRAGMLSGVPSTDEVVVWLSYNVHGNEASSTEAAMKTIYELVRPDSPLAPHLDNSVIIIDPCINPDGRDRYVNFYQQTGQNPYNPDPQSQEHYEPWPGGRQNHYLFDLNRDWAWLSQIESQQRIAVYNTWMPQIHVDFHEQGYNSPYYFAPAAEPYHELITNWQREFQITIGKNNAKYFDKEGWLYFTKQRFDLLYPSYGDTYPTYNGAIGMTYEQAGHGRAGLGIIKEAGDTLTLTDRLTHHYTTGISTIEMAVVHRQKLLEEFGKFFSTPVKSSYKSFIIRTDSQDKIDRLAKWLDAHGIVYGTTSLKTINALDYTTRKSQTVSLSSADLIISTQQPKGVLASILFEPTTYVSDSLTYDITAWSAPYAFGVQAFAASTVIPISGSFPNSSIKKQTAPEFAYAFLFEWKDIADARLLAGLHRAGIKVRVLDQPVTTGGKTFGRGTLVVTRTDNKNLGKAFENTITELANSYNRKFISVTSGYMEEGPDLGAYEVRLLDSPKIAILAGDGVSPTEFGAQWYFMEQELNSLYSVIYTSRISQVDWGKYDVLVVQSGGYFSLRENELKRIDEWVKAGGKLILIQDALRKWIDSDYADLSGYSSDSDKEKIEKLDEQREESLRFLPYASGERESAKELLPGAIYKVKLDATDPLAYGYTADYFTLKTSELRVGYLESGNVGMIDENAKPVNGFVGAHVQKKMAGTLVMGVENRGRGQLVYFVDNPLFRAFWHSGKLAMANALFITR